MTKEPLKQDEQNEAILEIDENGNIRNFDGELLQSGRKPVILRDPEGEY